MALLSAQTQVQVRSTFDGAWLGGFEVVEAVETPVRAYRLRRRSDRFVLPRMFAAHEVRRHVSRPGSRPDRHR